MKSLNKLSIWLLALLAICIGLYPLVYIYVDNSVGLLSSKSPETLASPIWRLCFYTHISFGGLALLVGWSQFIKSIRLKYRLWHIRIGYIYMVSVLLSGLSSIFISFYTTGGFISGLGFFCLGIVWLVTTILALFHVLKKDHLKHQEFMTYSYAACFAAVTLRIWLPLLALLFGDFISAYLLVAWLCWIPNLIVAHSINKRNLKYGIQ